MSKYLKKSNCSQTRIPWCDIHEHISAIGRETETIHGDGFCLINAIRACLLRDHKIELGQRTIQWKIWREVKDRIPFYVEFAVNQTEEQVLKDVNKYLKTCGKNYTLPVIDVIIGAVVNCLNINIKIWESHKGFKKEIEFEPEKHKSPLTIYLLYTRDDIPQDDVHNANAHYDAIVLKNNTNTDSDASILHVPDDEDILKVSQVCNTTSSPLNPHLAKYNIAEEDIYGMDMTVYKGMAGKRVGVQPYDIDGNVLYTIKCKNNKWHTKQLDGRYWATTTGKNKKLRGIGVRKVSRCKGDLVCRNKKCMMYLAHNISNTLNFEAMVDEYRCKHCDQFTKRSWCGAQKAVEYNRNTETMTIWHQGLHKCRLRPGNKSKEEQHQAKETVKRVMRKFPKMSRHEQARAGARAAMEDGKPELADYIIESYEDLKLYNTVKKDMHKTLLGTERHSIDAVATVKKAQERYDRFHIYEVNDKKMNGQPSYVFKSSTPMAKIALLMDQDNPQKTPFQDAVVFMDGLHSHVKDYITLTLWLHNPVIRHMQRIAYMDCESENVHNISKFLSLVNKMLRELKGYANYIWNPRAIMT